MISAYIVIGLMTLSLFIIAVRRNDGSCKQGFFNGIKTFKSMFSILFIAFILAGLLPQAIPPEVIQKWLGNESSWKGIIIGSISGALIPGGPYVAFPIISSIYKSGASLGTAVSFVTSWATCGIMILIFEISILDYKFSLMRYSLVVILPFVAGFLTYYIF